MTTGALLDCSVPDSYRSRASSERRKTSHLGQEGAGSVETGSCDSCYSWALSTFAFQEPPGPKLGFPMGVSQRLTELAFSWPFH